jgi:inhibitor of KinA
MKITPLGDSAFTVAFPKLAGAEPAEKLRRVWAAQDAINRAGITGVIETVPSYESVTVFFDPLVLLRDGVDPTKISAWINERIIVATARRNRTKKRPGRDFEIPVCFDEEFALDLRGIAAERRRPAEAIIQQFCQAKYEVACIGFTPGFPYLVGLPAELNIPRRPTPRVAVPGGSVAIAGGQAGIYPVNSPGGWNVVGRTPMVLFDPQQDPPALLAAGDRIRFKQIARTEFDAIRALPDAGS